MVKTLSKSRSSGKIFLKFFLIFLIVSSTTNVGAQEKHSQKGAPEPDLKVGERLYYGLISTGEDAKACASCHTYYTSDTINWNPSALEMAQVAADMDLATFKSHLLTPSGAMREKVHINYELTDEQLFNLHGYLTELADSGVPQKKMSINTILIFLLLGVLMAVALVDIFFTKKIKFKLIHILIIMAGLAYQGKVIAHTLIDFGRSPDYMPDQPIKFSHKVHAQDNQIDCNYCHYNAQHGKSAGIPSAGLCMNCHMVVRNGTNSGQFEIAKIVDAYENNNDIEWIRIHNLPDHVYFNHSQHVNAGQLDCAECHGTVEEMHILKQENDLSMGWCLDCHKKTNVNFRDNDYYKTFEALHKDIQEGALDSIKAADVGANDCMNCHH
ncbi:cytochrome c3 family protein [Carboxylicivirga linearis]|uniref:Cytochrome c3 family protein n=1 Tax=Carboxylicivirga linearis TaxID=1628157 RepID=A0ABS5JQW4_9BACT|nr:cytochrome c3 family protein [Carboxylicivirga linearis]MBS2096871.1 cytochrome c3 family protein [Carboxylicivirga linearis]